MLRTKDIEKIIDPLGEDYEDTFLEKTGLEIENPGDSDCYYVGRSFTTIKDNETGAAFKQSVTNKLSELLGKKVKCTTISEAWYDG
jgi:hypothetical protein